MTIIELLRKTRELISKGKWIKGTAFRDKLGRFSVVQTAEMFCLYGGLKRVSYLDTGRTEGIILVRAAGEALNSTEIVKDYGSSYIAWQDDEQRTKADVLTAIDQAVELLKTNKVQ